MSEQDEATAAAQAMGEQAPQGEQQAGEGAAPAAGDATADPAPAPTAEEIERKLEGLVSGDAATSGDEDLRKLSPEEEAAVRAEQEAAAARREAEHAPIIPGAPPSAQPRDQAESVHEAIATARSWIDGQRRWSRVEKSVAHEATTYLASVLGAA